MLTRLRRAARAHRHFFLVIIPLTVIMTLPAASHAAAGAALRLPTRNTDIWMKVWDAWHLQRALAGEAELFYSDALFYPRGLSLAYQNFSLPHMLTVNALALVLPLGSALNIAYMLIVFAAAASAYLCIGYFLRDPWLALLGAVIFGFSQHVTRHFPHPDVNLIVTLPLSLYFFQRGLDENRWRWLLACGLTVGLTAFFSIYILVCAALALGVFMLGAALSRWRSPRFWLMLAAVILVSALIAAPRLAPMLLPPQNLGAALEKNVGGETGNDLLAYFINYQHPILTPLQSALFNAKPPPLLPQTSYLGYLPLLLIAAGLARRDYRRRILGWLGMALPFFLLRLGTALRVNTALYPEVPLPKAFLDDLLPLLFKPFHAADHFQMGLLLPLALMAGYGFKALWGARPPRQRAVLALACIGIIAFEYAGTSATREIPRQQLAYIDWLAADSQADAQEEIRLINLPLGRQPSKWYAFYQARSGYPHAEGLSGRTDAAAYQYIDDNLLLSAWRGGNSILCAPLNEAHYRAALRQLEADGFSHIVWHHTLERAEQVGSSFQNVAAAYEDRFVSIFRLADLSASCHHSPALSGAMLAGAALPSPGQAALLRIEAAEDPAATLLGQHEIHHIRLEDLPSAPPAVMDALAANSVMLLVYPPAETSAAVLASYRDWLSRHFDFCGPLPAGAGWRAEYAIRAGYPCALGLTAQPLAVDYDNGMALANALSAREGDTLKLYLMWAALPRAAYAFSLQIMDAAGARLLGADFTFQYEALSQGALELSPLPPGSYSVNLIVYEYATGITLPGIIRSSGTRFERALTLDRLTIEDAAEDVEAGA